MQVELYGSRAGPEDALADLAVSGVPGWVRITATRSQAVLRMRVWAPVGVEVFVRPPLPLPAVAAPDFA